MKKYILFIFILSVFIPAANTLKANDRRFAYTYETSVLPRGAREIEIWNTYRTDRNYFYRRLDQRVEYEFGLGGNVMSALYLNASYRLQDSNGNSAGGDAVQSQEFSISSEWKYKIMDRVASPLGLGLYGEATLGLNELELEGKLLLDKQVNNFLVAFNGVIEHEWETELEDGEAETEKELALEFDLGTSYQLTGSFSFGFELRNINVIEEGTIEKSALFIGPVLAYTEENWWATLTLLPQVKALKGETADGLVLDDHEKVEARLLFSFHL